MGDGIHGVLVSVTHELDRVPAIFFWICRFVGGRHAFFSSKGSLLCFGVCFSWEGFPRVFVLEGMDRW